MTAYQLLPGLSPEEYDALRSDISAHGIRVPVDVDENGQVLDGHHRSLIAAELGIDCPRRVLADLTEPEKVAHAIAVNVHRRSLSREQRRELLAASIKAEPEASDREHARRTGSSHPTAADVRRELVESGDVEELSTRTDSAGRQQPASKPPVPLGLSKHTDKTETYFDSQTGEVVDPGSVPIDQHPDYQPRWQPEPPSEQAQADRDRRVSAEAFRANLAKNAWFFARLARPDLDAAPAHAAKYVPDSAAAFGGVDPAVLRDAARYLLALADAWKKAA